MQPLSIEVNDALAKDNQAVVKWMQREIAKMPAAKIVL